jgi:hypothetical protein
MRARINCGFLLNRQGYYKKLTDGTGGTSHGEGTLLDDREQVRLELLLDQSNRMYRAGGRAPANWIIWLVAVVCGLIPFLLLMAFPVANMRPRYAPFAPVILDFGLPLAVGLSGLITLCWASRSQRRRALVITALTAACPTMLIYIFGGGPSQEGLISWTIWHLLHTTATVLAIMVAMWVVGSSPPSAPLRWLASGNRDRADRARRPGETLARYISVPWFGRKSPRQAAEPAE